MFKNIFNIILLALIFTTISITIISYIIFRIRQLSATKNSGSLHFLNGVYFTRFAPKLIRANKNKELAKSNNGLRNFKIKFALTSVLTFGLVSFILVLENHFSFREEMLERSDRAKTYRHLIENGLLQKYQYDPDFKINGIIQTLTPLQHNHYKKSIEMLKSKNIYLYSSPNDQRIKIDNNAIAVKRWQSFCKKSSLRCIKTRTIPSAKKDTLLILPKVSSLSRLQRKKIRHLVSHNIPIAITGDVGTLNGLGGVSKSENIKKDLFKNAIENFSLGNNFSKKTNFEEKSVEFMSQKNSVWIRRDPESNSSKIDDLFFLQLLRHAHDQFTISLIPKSIAERSIFLSIISSESTLSEFLSNLLEELKYPITIISSSAMPIKKDPEKINYELSLYGDVLNNDFFTNKTLFDKIQKQRLDFEEKSQKHVNGIWFAATNPSPHILKEIAQNKLDYISFMTESTRRKHPYHIDNDIWIYPGFEISDKDILSDVNTIDVEKALEKAQAEISKYDGHLHPIRMIIHQDLYQNKFAQRFLTDLFKDVLKRRKIDSFGTLAHSQKLINKMDFSYKVHESYITININNPSLHSIENAALIFSSSRYSIVSASPDGTLFLPKIPPGQTKIQFKYSPLSLE